MMKQIPIYLYGAIILLVGVFLLTSVHFSLERITLTLVISLILASVLAFVTAFIRQRHQVQFAYHELHALAMLVYALALFWFSNSIERLIAFTTFLFIFYAFSEIIFCIWLFNLAQRVYFKIALIRVLLGLVIGIGTIFAMRYNEMSLQIFGVLFILVGINAILYVPVMKANLGNKSSLIEKRIVS